MSWQQSYNPNYHPPAGAPQRHWAPPQQSAPPPPTAYSTPPQGHVYQQSPEASPQGYAYQQPPNPSGSRNAPPHYGGVPPSSYGGGPQSGYGGGPPSGYGGGPPSGYGGGPPSGYSGGPPSGYGGGPPSGYGGGPPSGYGGSSPSGHGGGPPTSNGRTGPTGGPPGGPPGVPPGVGSDVFSWFQIVDHDKSGKITASELRDALLNNNWSHFNSETCRLLIGMFDSNGDGSIDIQEFAALWKYVQEWKSCFDTFDKDKSGNIDSLELQQALQSFGYQLSMEFCNLCTRVFDRSDKRTMKFDDFIQCCVMLKSLTEGFKKMDTNRTGLVTISYEQFLEMAVDNTM